MQQVLQVPLNSLQQQQPHLPELMRAVVSCELSVLEFSVLLSRVVLSNMNQQLEVMEEKRQDFGLRHPAIP